MVIFVILSIGSFRSNVFVAVFLLNQLVRSLDLNLCYRNRSTAS